MILVKPTKHRPKLSICIPSLHNRCLSRELLLTCLSEQPGFDQTEILISIDSGQQTTGEKRNYLVSKAIGDYIVHIDDDDLVSSQYLYCVLKAIEQRPDVVLVRGQRTGGGPSIDFDYRLGAIEPEGDDGLPWDGKSCLWRTPSHLCPVRSGIAKSIEFPNQMFCEDAVWWNRLAPKLNTFERAGVEGQILYWYQYVPNKYEIKTKTLDQKPKEVVIDKRCEVFGRHIPNCACTERKPI